MKILNRIKQLFSKKAEPVKRDLSKLSTEELEAGMMNSLVKMGAITAKEGQEFLFTGEMPSPELISKRIMEIYGK